MDKAPTVYLDANILRFSQTSLLRLMPRKSVIDWGHAKSEMIVHDLIYFNPNTRLKNPELRREADLLEDIATFVKDGKLKAVMQMETDFESWSRLQLGNDRGRFYGAKIDRVEAPIKYDRILLGARFSAKELQLRFLAGIKHKCFTELQKITGAIQGENKYNQRQLLDAFHIWCAEHNHCNYFLTLDFRLIKMVTRHKLKPDLPILVRPSQLLLKMKI